VRRTHGRWQHFIFTSNKYCLAFIGSLLAINPRWMLCDADKVSHHHFSVAPLHYNAMAIHSMSVAASRHPDTNLGETCLGHRILQLPHGAKCMMCPPPAGRRSLLLREEKPGFPERGFTIASTAVPLPPHLPSAPSGGQPSSGLNNCLRVEGKEQHFPCKTPCCFRFLNGCFATLSKSR
jgi:hypothetical protein